MSSSDLSEPTRPLPNIELATHVRFIAITDDLIAVNKPAGFHSAPLKAEEHSTMLNAVATLHPEVASAGGLKAIEGLLLHRLDRGTSGTLLFARSAAAFTVLRKLWKQRTLEKDYLAWVPGRLEIAGTLSLTAAHSPKSKKRMVVLEALGPAARREAEAGRVLPALTTVQTLHVTKTHSLVWLRLHSGVMHQARIVLAALGHPVCEDPLYATAKGLSADAVEEALASGTLENKSLKRNPPPATNKNSRFQEFGDALSLRGAQPQPELLPDHGFFLHALRVAAPAKATKDLALSSDTIAHLSDGLLSPPPIWFGVS